MKRKNAEEFNNFDKVMGGLLAVPYSELQHKLEKEKRDKEKKKKRPTLTASSRVSASRKRRVS
jgi:inner membrane protein involved in colicin E2 resistance